MDTDNWDSSNYLLNGQLMSQRVPNTGLFDVMVDDHGYYTSTLYPMSDPIDSWQLTKDENVMVGNNLNFKNKFLILILMILKTTNNFFIFSYKLQRNKIKKNMHI